MHCDNSGERRNAECRSTATNNTYIESFNGGLRYESFYAHCYADLNDAGTEFHASRKQFNETRPHTALNDLLPQELKAQWTSLPLENR